MAEGKVLEMAAASERGSLAKSLVAALAACAFSLGAVTVSVAFPAAKSYPNSSALQPVAVFGTDHRIAVPEKWSALEGRIGMLYEQSTQTLCTAFCVAENIVATASHCLFQPKNNQLPDLKEVTFRLNYGKTLRQSKIAGNSNQFTKNSIAVGTTAFKNEPPLTAPKDWALVKLEMPICKFGVIKVQPMPVQELIEKSQDNKIFQIAYHWDYNPHWELAYSQPCRIGRDFGQLKWRDIRQHFINADDLVLHTCDTGGASSGSPILLDTSSPNNPNSQPVAVAINVGTYTRTSLRVRDGRIIKRFKPDIIANTAVNAPAFERVIGALGNADLIASRNDMLKLQGELQSRGFYTGTIDGNLGRNLRTAIVNYENFSSIAPTGIPSRALLQRLNEDRVKPSHLFSTGTGNVDDFANPPPQNGPVRRPPPPLNKNGPNLFDPFRQNR